MMRTTKNRLAALILSVALLISTAAPAAAEVFSAVVTAKKMTVYADAALSQAIDALGKGEIVRVEAYSGKAAKIVYDGGDRGFARVSDMKTVDSVAAKGVVNAGAKVYDSPSEKARSASVDAGERVYVLDTEGEWARVEKDGAVGYMKLAALTKANADWSTGAAAPTPTPAPKPLETATVTANTLPVYKSDSSSSGKLGTLKKGQTVNVVKWGAKWAYVELNGRYGYCAMTGIDPDVEPEALENAAAVSVTVSASKLPVYKSKDTDSKKLGTLKKGQVVGLVSSDDEWACIELNGNRGWAKVSGLSEYEEAVVANVAPTPTPSVENAAKGTVTVSSLAVYKTASSRADKLGTLQKGDTVNVIKWNASWALIERDGHYGFCVVSGLTRTDVGAAEQPTAAPSLEGAVPATLTKEAKVYRTASTSSDALGKLKKGDSVNVISVSGDWAYIEKSGNYGFIKTSALSGTGGLGVPSGYVSGGFTATVVYPGALAYEKASASAKSGSVALGKEVVVAAYSKKLDWALVNFDGVKAYMRIDHLNRAGYSAVSGTGSASQTLLKALLTLGYYDGPTSASAGSDLAKAAIKRFQAACGLSETGEADQTLQRILYGGYAPESDMLSMSLSAGSNGANVARLQTRLYVLGYLSQAASLDGDYGSTTAAAVALFQQANGVSVSGVADGATLRAMYSTGANSRPSGVKAADDPSGGTSVTPTETTGGGVVTPPSKVTLSSTYVTTMPAALKSTTSKYSSSQTNAQKLEHVIYSAQVKLGKPYVYGATGPNSYDCSGLTQYSFKQVSVSLKRTAYSQGYDSSYTKISGTSSLKRGDLVFFNTVSDSDLCDHVGIYLGGGCFIHASSGGHKVVVSNLSSGYYNRVFSWGRRILG